MEKQPASKIIWKPLDGSQSLAVSCPCNHILYEGTRGPGKGLHLDEPVLTDSGWKKAGDITYADKLVASDGSYTTIEGIFPQGEKDLYRVTFDEGQQVLVDDTHRWSVYDGKNGHRLGWQVKNTLEVMARLEKTTLQTPRLSNPVGGKKWEGLDPYIAGLLLGDGTLSTKYTTLYSADSEIVTYVSERGWSVGDYGRGCKQMWPATKDESRDWQRFLGTHKREHKVIPSGLLEADADTRLALLQGLLDSDGTAELSGAIKFCNTSLHLIHGVQYLVRSLGGKATYRWRVRKDGIESANGLGGNYILNINLPAGVVPFRLTRKACRVKNTYRHGNHRAITKVEYVGRGETVCFAVAHPSHEFVIRDFVITHNTDAQLMFFRRFVGMGYGQFWRGVIFDREYKNLDDLVSKSKRWFRQFGDKARFLSSGKDLKWVWPSGEELLFRVMKTDEDYWNYHGQEFPFIGWNELTKYPNDNLYNAIMSCNRSSFLPATHSPDLDKPLPDIPLVVFSTTNPYGVGHNWVKQRFVDPAPPGKVIKMSKEVFNPRTQQREMITKTQVRLFGSYKENVFLSPEYVLELESIKDPNKRRAWLWGDWDITSGGMFDDVWSSQYNIVTPFTIPPGWRMFRSFDWGSSKPFSVGWWAESDGSDVVMPNGEYRSTVKGDLFRIAEWYGWTGAANQGLRLLATQIAKGIVERELKMGYYGRIKPGPADNSINDVENGNCIALDMAKKVLVNGKSYSGVTWTKSNKSPGSRKNGWEKMRIAMFNAQPDGKPREEPGLFIFRNCQDGFIRTVPTIPRDTKDLDDVDTNAEDHTADEVRYVILSVGDRFKTSSTTGYY